MDDKLDKLKGRLIRESAKCGLRLDAAELASEAAVLAAAGVLRDPQIETEFDFDELIIRTRCIELARKTLHDIKMRLAASFLNGLLPQSGYYLRENGLKLLSLVFGLHVEVYIRVSNISPDLRCQASYHCPDVGAGGPVVRLLWNGRLHEQGGHFDALIPWKPYLRESVDSSSATLSTSVPSDTPPPSPHEKEESGEEYEKDQEERMSVSRSLCSSSTTAAQRAKWASNKRKWREQMTEEQRQRARDRNAAAMRRSRAKETPEEARERRERESAAQRKRFSEQRAENYNADLYATESYAGGKLAANHVKLFETSPLAAQLQFAGSTGLDVVATPGATREERRAEVISGLQPISPAQLDAVIQSWNRATDFLSRPLQICAACGVQSLGAEVLFRAPLADLGILRLNPAEHTAYFRPENDDYRAAWDVFVQDEQTAFWLHPNLVEASGDFDGSFVAPLCSSCEAHLLPKSPLVAPKLPRYDSFLPQICLLFLFFVANTKSLNLQVLNREWVPFRFSTSYRAV